MKAAQISSYGDASNITINEVEVPTVGDGQVGVEVHAASINPVDSKIRLGYFDSFAPLSFPATLGGDFAGIVRVVGKDVTHIGVGDSVYGQSNAAFGNTGTFAEFTTTNAGQVAKAPENISLSEASSLPLVGASAIQALITHINLGAGDKILITGGAGGIGSIAIQIAKHLGADVTTTASGDGLTLAKELGADVIIDYKQGGLIELPNDFDAIFDTVGGESFLQVLPLLESGGTIVTMGMVDEETTKNIDGTVIAQSTSVTTDILNTLTELVEDGVVTPQIGRVFELNEIVSAFEAKENGTIPGKIVIDIR